MPYGVKASFTRVCVDLVLAWSPKGCVESEEYLGISCLGEGALGVVWGEACGGCAYHVHSVDSFLFPRGQYRSEFHVIVLKDADTIRAGLQRPISI